MTRKVKSYFLVSQCSKFLSIYEYAQKIIYGCLIPLSKNLDVNRKLTQSVFISHTYVSTSIEKFIQRTYIKIEE